MLLIAWGARGASLIEQIGWRGADWRVLIGFSVVVGVAMAGLALMYVRRQRTAAREANLADERVFGDTAERLGLSPAEVAVSRRLLQRHPTPIRPQVLFQSITVFEKCVDREIAGLIGRRAAAETLDEADRLISSIRQKIGFMHVPLEHPLVSTRNLALGQVGSIYGRDSGSPLVRKASVSRRDERTFTLQYKADQEEMVRIAPGDEIRFAFARHNDGLYGIALRVAESDGAGHVVVYHTTDVRRNQLRQYVRIETSLPLKLRLVQTRDEERGAVARGQRVEGRMADISGGGLSFLCEQMLKPGDLVSVSFALPNARFSGVSCKVLRIGLQEGKTTTYYKHHAQFVHIEDRKRDAIVRYVFEKQRQISQWR
jgi:c-di-GMP-binding flagellar brake protein YcgR